MLIARFGWESVFWIFGSLGFVWLLGWQPLVRDDTAPAAALAALAADGVAPVVAAPAAAPPALRLQDVPWADFARNKAFWAIVAAQCTVSVGNVLAFRCVRACLVEGAQAWACPKRLGPATSGSRPTGSICCSCLCLLRAAGFAANRLCAAWPSDPAPAPSPHPTPHPSCCLPAAGCPRFTAKCTAWTSPPPLPTPCCLLSSPLVPQTLQAA